MSWIWVNAIKLQEMSVFLKNVKIMKLLCCTKNQVEEDFNETLKSTEFLKGLK